MFTGLIEEIGRVRSIQTKADSTQLRVSAPSLAPRIGLGESVAVNGCCLTVAAKEGDSLGFDVLAETLDRTNLKTLRPSAAVNLERALAAYSRLGGHFVQGHIDCATEVISLEKSGNDFRLEVSLPAEFARYCACKGSIAIDGISLTIAELLPKSFVVWIIPHTRQHTNLQQTRPGDLVNLEFDVLAKYVERMLPPCAPKD